MFVRVNHARMLRKLKEEKNASKLSTSNIIARREFSRVVMELHVMGLAKISGDDIVITSAGEHIVKAFEAINVPEDKIPDPWINSAVIYALELAELTGYVPKLWEDMLEARGLWSNGLTKAATEVLEAYRRARPLIYVTPEIAEFLIGLPPGPAPLDELIAFRDSGGYGHNVVNALEATRLLRISPPTPEGSTYILTPVGRKVRRALLRTPIYDSVIIIDERIVDLMQKKDLSEAEVNELERMHLKSGTETTSMGKELIESYKEQIKVKDVIVPFSISVEELAVMKAIEEFTKKYSPEEPVPTYSDLRDKVPGVNLGEILHLLEAKELVKRVEKRSKDTYELTDIGLEVLSKFRDLDRSITSSAVKSATYTVTGRPPKAEWVKEGRELGIIFNDITERGWFLINIAKRIHKKPFLTIYDANIVHKVPTKGMKIDELTKNIANTLNADENGVIRAISEAESKGLVDVLPNDVVVLTQLGRTVKDVISMASTNELLKSRISITPTHYNVLLIIKENIRILKKLYTQKDLKTLINEEVKIIYNNIKKVTSISVNEIKKTLQQLRAYGLLGRTGVTEAGELLLKAYM